MEFVKERLSQVIQNKFYKQESELLEDEKVKAYYNHIIKNIELDQSNKSNSYIMWLVGKVSSIDMDSPAKITEVRASLPDIDSDFEVSKRDVIIKYIENKYGSDKVSQMATFGKMMGRSAIKDVLRAHSACNFEEMNKITEFIPDEASIADDLQTMMEEDGESSIIWWALENRAEKLKQWCYINEDGVLEGPMAIYFEQAIRLEGTKRSQGKHASGIVIFSEPLEDVVPMLYDKNSGKPLIGIDMRDAESMGLVKNDILGLATLDKIQTTINIIRNGNPYDILGENHNVN